MPDSPRRVEPRRREAGADLEALAAIGLAERPSAPPEGPPPAREDVYRLLVEAFAEAGVSPDADELAALQRLAALPPGTVRQVAKWIKRGRRAGQGSQA